MSLKKAIGHPVISDHIPVLLFFFIAVSAFFTLFIVPYSHDDAGYYFKYAQEVANGVNGVLYKDIKLNYSPLPIYLYSIVFKITGALPGNGLFLTVNYLFVLGTSFMMYHIFKILNVKKDLSFIALSIYIISVIGMGISSTEHFVVFFEVLMLFCLLTAKRFSFVLAGLCAFLAFYSKQYGIISIAIGSAYFVIHKEQLSKLPYFLIGILIPNIVLFFLYPAAEGFSIFDLYERLIFPQKNEHLLTGENYGIMVFIQGLMQFLMIVPYLFLAFYFYWSKRLYFNKSTNFLLMFVLISFAPFVIASFLHYYLLVLPFVVLFAVSTFKEYDFGNSSLNRIIGAMVAIAIICSVGSFFRIRKIDGEYISSRTIGLHPNEVLQNDCKSLNTIIPRGSKVFIVESVFFYYPADFYSIDLKNLGYTWAQQYNQVDDILKYLDRGEYILMNTHSRFKSYPEFVEKSARYNPEYEIYNWVGNYHYLKTQKTGYYILLKK